MERLSADIDWSVVSVPKSDDRQLTMIDNHSFKENCIKYIGKQLNKCCHKFQ